jgi:type II secretory pathway pseudopilin PulG
MSDKRRDAGFTIPELLVAGFLVLVIILLSFIFVHPRDYVPQNRNADRWLGVAHLMQALNRYEAENHHLPTGLTDKPQIIGNNQDELDWCGNLVPKYMEDVPLDPTRGYQVAVDTCLATDDSPTAYSTGFSIKKSKDGTVTITAPYAEGKQDIHLSHKY